MGHRPVTATAPTRSDAAKVGGILAAAALIAPVTLAAEGRVTTTAPDPVGIATAGYGHAGAIPGKTYSDAEIVQLAVLDLAKAGAAIDPCLKADVPVKMRAAFTDFAFNAGAGTFCKSTMAARANAGDLKGACAALSLYVYAAHKPLPGLVTRRAAERALCEAGIAEAAATPPVALPAPSAPMPAKPSWWRRFRSWWG